ncbi:T9SS type A sorting domain-containing protein [Flavobacterium cellulosilyticum]
MTNILGKTVCYEVNNLSHNVIDISKLSSGIYLLSVNSGDGIQ